MSHRDDMMTSLWEEIKSETAIVDPFRIHCPKTRIYSFISNAGKSRGDRAMSTKKKYSFTPFIMGHEILSFTFKD